MIKRKTKPTASTFIVLRQLCNLIPPHLVPKLAHETGVELFEPFGTVSEVKLIMDRETGQSRGFGFVTMSNVSEGNAAIKGLDGKDKGGRKLKVNEARPKDDRGGRPSPRSHR